MTASAGRRSGAEKLSDHLFDRVSEEILALPPGTASDVYVLSLNVVGDKAGAKGLRVEFGYNTETRWRRCTPEPGQEPGWPVASSPEEARWNYAFWLHDAYVPLLDEDFDPSGARLLHAWISEEGLDRADADGELDWYEIEERFWGLSIELAKRLHDCGIVTSKFGRTLPIVVHEAHMDEDSFEATREANPGGQAAEFLEGW